ncbi:kelch repeat-containing protein [Prosthecobacter sp.]|uniref:Kelch repeat-containing protein n=1 Tax=Prosthecobacter sp. TaxID=1965333 RepID=UPI0037844B14
MRACSSLPAVLFWLILAVCAVHAQVPGLLNYQGRVAVGSVNFNGSGQFKFALVNSGGGTTFWSNDGTSTAGAQPAAAVTLAVTKGLYSVLLGDTTLANMTTVPASVFGNPDVRLRVWFNDGVNGFQLLTPDQRIAAVGYAMTAGGVANGAITSSMLAPGAVGTSQLAPGAAAANLAAGGVSGVPSGGIVASNDPASTALLAQGFVRDPSSTTLGESWTPMPSGDAVAGHSAVWTGTELLVWGGVVPDNTNTGMPPAYKAINRGLRYNPSTGAWIPISTVGAPQQRFYHSAVWTGTQMIVWGGQTTASTSSTGGTPATVLATGGIYTPATDTWTAMAPNGSIPFGDGRSRAQAFWTGTDLLIWGGSMTPLTFGFSYPGGGGVGKRYNLATNTWSSMAANPPEIGPSIYWSGVWTGSSMIVWGSQTVGDSTLPSAGKYTPATDTWQTLPRVPGNPALPTTGFTTAWTGNEMILWGGYDGTSIYSNAGYRFNPTTSSWTSVSTAGAPAARTGHSAVMLGGKMIVWGGQSSSGGAPPVSVNLYQDGGIYDPVANTWQSVTASNAPPYRTEATVTTASDRIIVWAGVQTPDFGTTSKFLKNGGSYQPATGTWTTLANGSPAPRFGQTAVWTGTDLIVWGGTAGSFSAPANGIDFTYNDGARYTPATGVWTPLPAANAPSGRFGHSAVWTGTEMIVWGGMYGNAPIMTTLNTGARYNPQTNAWTPMTTASAPSARAQPGLVWAGAPTNRMIVWGGTSDGLSMQVTDGSRYDPVSDTWSSLSTTNAPNASFSFTVPSVTWSGKEMMVFSPTLMNGGLYYPASDTWLTMAAAPMALNTPTPWAVLPLWVGTGLAAFAPGSVSGTGSGGSFYLYSPTADYWQASAATGGPTGTFQNASTVWTGSSLILWGGIGTPTTSYAGGIYTPATDTWSSLSSSGAPAATFGSSVWTGSEMVMWGGTSNVGGVLFGSPSDKGYRYTPPQSYYLYRRP